MVGNEHFLLVAQVCMCAQIWPEATERGKDLEFILERLSKAKLAAEESVSLQRSGSGTGEILRSNFLLLHDAVMEQDSHLFSWEETQVFEAFKVRHCQAVSQPRLVCKARVQSLVRLEAKWVDNLEDQ